MAVLTAQWQQWIQENLDRQVPPQSLVQVMLENQFEPLLAETVVKAVMEGRTVGAQFVEIQQDKRLTAPDNTHSKSSFEALEPCHGLGQPWSLLMSLDKPVVRTYTNVLTHDECDHLIAISKAKLKPSQTVDNETGASVPHEHRTSQGTFFHLKENEFIQQIDERLAQLMRYPIENGEGLQILNYQVGGEYRPHFDYFPEQMNGSAVHLKNGGQRVATLILYLNQVEAGGETIFPELGLKVSPHKGGALYFSYFNHGLVDPLTLHGGAPVIAGEKWIATKWVRESAFYKK
jgi:prolyl 4-hydroxylase